MSLKEELIYYSKLCYKNGFVAATDGNLSTRTKRNTILTTASEKCKGRLGKKDIVEVNINGIPVRKGAKPSTEFKLHSYIYKSRKDIGAVIHTHPVFATAFAVAGIALDKIVLPEVFLKLGKIPLAAFGTPSTIELPESISPFVKDYNAILLSNHGLLTYGKSLEEAYFLTEKVEQFAEISFYARLLGGERELSKTNIQKLAKLKKGNQKSK